MGVSLRAFLFSSSPARGEGEGEEDEEDGQSSAGPGDGGGGEGNIHRAGSEHECAAIFFRLKQPVYFFAQLHSPVVTDNDGKLNLAGDTGRDFRWSGERNSRRELIRHEFSSGLHEGD